MFTSLMDRAVTVIPFFGFISIRPSCSSLLKASRMGVLLIFNSSVSISSFKNVPGAYSQVTIFCLIVLYAKVFRLVLTMMNIPPLF